MRYKGSKAWLAPLMERLLPDAHTVVSPFLGSGKVELALLRRGLRVQGSDAWRPLVTLYEAALARPSELAARLNALQTPSRQEYRELLAAEPTDALDQAARVYQVLHNSYDGEWGKYAPRKPASACALHRLLRDASARARLTVTCRDAFEVLSELRPGVVLYLDPPYLLKGRRRYPTADHSLAFHRRLATALRECPVPFALSVNDAPQAHQLYGDWCATLRPRANELLFLWPPAWWPV
jgi:site-specific DNA-adenine methylase